MRQGLHREEGAQYEGASKAKAAKKSRRRRS